MRSLSLNEMEQVEGGIVPALWAGIMAYNYVVATYSAVQIATAAGVAVGAVSTAVALTN